jgi:glycosyltransferase involved in cell wall biosynthesis
MKLKALVRGPALSQSGYGEHARMVLRSLRTKQDIFDLYVDNLSWGRTSWLWQDDEERHWLDSLILKSVQHKQSGGKFDISFQVTIPNEWEVLAPINIGCTAGIESNKIAPAWVEKSYMMDKIIVVSEFAKRGFDTTSYEFVNQEVNERRQVSAKGPIHVVNYPHRPVEPAEAEFDLKHDFNFLCISQWSPRKNFENTIRWFVEEFYDQEVGLVLKSSLANNGYIDYNHTAFKIKRLLAEDKYEGRKCSVHLLHGYLKDDEMAALYRNPKVKALINIAHGEGYGLPMFEAAGHGLPIVTVGWSGQTDFLYVPEKVKGSKKKKLMPKFAEVEFSMAPIQREAVWDGVLSRDSMWAYADQGSFKMALRDVHKKYSVYERRAEVLQNYVVDKFSEEKIYQQFVDCALEGITIPDDTEIDEMYSELFG